MKKYISLTVMISFGLIQSFMGSSESIGATSDRILAIAWEDSLLVSFDPYAGIITEVHAQLNPTESFRGLAYDPNHNMLYALSQVAFNLYAIDPMTLEIQHIGNLRLPCGAWDIGGLTYDPSGDIFYVTLNQIGGEQSELLTVDVDNAKVKRVGVINNGYFFSPSFSNDDGHIYGFALYGSGSWNSSYKASLVSINPDDMAMKTWFETPYHTILGLAKKPDENIFYYWVNWTSHFYGRINPETEVILDLGSSDPVGVASDAMIVKNFYVGSGALLPTKEKPATFDFAGHVTDVRDPNGLVKDDIAVGDAFFGQFTYDINEIYLNNIDQSTDTLFVKIGTRTFSFGDFSAGVENNYYDCDNGIVYDAFHLNSESRDNSTDSIAFNITLTDYSSVALTDNIFLPVQFDMSAWDENSFCIYGSDPSDEGAGFSVHGVLDEIISDIDSDGDGVPDHSDNCPDDPEKTEPGMCGCGKVDSDKDRDNDGTFDCNDACPDDPEKIVPGICGCGVPDSDTDNDGTMDCYDECPKDPDKTAPDVCGCGISDIDSDGDGISDCDDLCPHDSEKTEPGICGCNTPDTDSDGDGTPDCRDTNGDNDAFFDLEEQGPEGNEPDYDGNNDGIADRLQENVVSFHTWNENAYITLASSAGTSITNCTVSENLFPANTPPGMEFSHGFFELTIEGLSVGGDLTVRLYFPAGNFFHTYYMYNPTPDSADDHWHEFLYDDQTGAVMDENVITLYFIDGMRGDGDLSANGTIVIIGGPGLRLNPVEGGGGGGCFISTVPISN